MIEGAIERFRNYQGIKDKNGTLHIYDTANNLVTKVEKQTLKNWVIKQLIDKDIESLNHPGIKIYQFEEGDYIYLFSFKDEIHQKYPDLSRWSYNQLYWSFKDVRQYIHNENGPGVISVDSKKSSYFFDGVELTKEAWQIKVKKINFDNKFEDWLNEV